MYEYNILLYQFSKILIFFITSIFIAVLIAVSGKLLSTLTGNNKPANKNKNSPFECGFSEVEHSRSTYDVRFYLIAILFLIFDLEIAFMIPWGIVIKQPSLINSNSFTYMSWSGFFAMVIFAVILFIGFIYEYKKGALEWE